MNLLNKLYQELREAKTSKISSWIDEVSRKIDAHIDWDNFTEWWINQDGFGITEKLYGKRAEAIVNRVDPNLEVLNIYSDTLEKFGWKYKLHLN